MRARNALAVYYAGMLLMVEGFACGAEAGFERLGVPVRKAMLMATAVGPDRSGEKDWLYFDFAQTGATLFLVVVDPQTGEAHQFKSPVGPGAWALIRGPDDKMYLGTWESGYILRFDAKAPEKGIQVVGKPSSTETYIWQFAVGPDKKLYGCTYGQAKLVSYDPATGQMEDLGRMDDTQMYTRSIATGRNGKIYMGVGYGRANIVMFDPATRMHRSILPERYRVESAASVHEGADGLAYAHCGGQAFRIDDEVLTPIGSEQVVAPKGLILRDGRIVTVGETTSSMGSYTLTDPRTGGAVSRTFKYEGDGAMLFVVGTGPEQRVYGSTAMPLEMFEFNPGEGGMRHLGNPTAVNGELYSLLGWEGRLYVCAYPGSYLSVYDPKRPFKFGTGAGDNPRGYGNLGEGHLRPRAMVLGPGARLYIGSLPPYGQLGGAMAAFDLRLGQVVENYRHLITNQSIVSLAYDAKSGLIFGGSSVAGGGGTVPVEKEARFFGFDPEKKAKVFESVLVSGVGGYAAMAVSEGVVFVGAGSELVMYDPSTMAIIEQIDVGGRILDISLGLHRSGKMYGLTGRGVFVVDTKRRKLEQVLAAPVAVTCGFGLTDEAVYFGSGAELWRYRIEGP